MEAKKTVRMALIGTGGMGRKYVNLILFGRIPGMELTAMVCRSESAKAWAADTLRTLPEGSESPRIFDSADALYAEPRSWQSALSRWESMSSPTNRPLSPPRRRKRCA